jgi:hypothetical protein
MNNIVKIPPNQKGGIVSGESYSSPEENKKPECMNRISLLTKSGPQEGIYK